MAYLEDLINQIDDETLKQNILKEVRGLKSSKKFGLVWEKSKENLSDTLKTMLPYPIQDPTLSVTKPVPAGKNPPPPHLLFEGDNLLALLALQATHTNKVDVIYIDPPYNTGKEFVYNDKIVDSEDYHRHSKWLSFMDTRLRLAKNLLKDTGVIFISIDDNEQANLKLLCDEIFGEKNFAGMALRKTVHIMRTSSELQKLHDYMLIYKQSEATAFKPRVSGQKVYDKKDTVGDYRLVPFWNTGPNASREARPNLYYDFYVSENGKISLEYISGWRKISPQGQRWLWSKNKILKDQNLIVISENGRPYIKRYRTKNEDLNTYSQEKLWLEQFLNAPGSKLINVMLGEKTFSYPKPIELIKWILELHPNQNAIVLDFFAGSGTTGHAVAQLNAEDGGNRQVILVTDNSGKVENGGFVSDAGTEGICRKVTFPRMQAVLTGVWADGKPHDALPGELRGFVMGGVERVESGEEQRKNVIGVADSFISLKTNMYEAASDGTLERLNFFDDISEELLNAYDDEAFDIYTDRNLETCTDEKSKSSGVNGLGVPVTVVWRDENVNAALIKELCETVEKVFNPPADSKFLYVGVLSGVGEDYIATELGDILPSWGVYGFGENFIAPMLRGLKEIE